jgi:hypothetical protein
MNRHPLTMAFDKHDYHVVDTRPNLFDELAAENAQRETVEYYERLARQARRFGRFGFANRATRKPSQSSLSRPSGRVSAIADYLSDPRFMVGVFVGTWFTVGASFAVAFL